MSVDHEQARIWALGLIEAFERQSMPPPYMVVNVEVARWALRLDADLCICEERLEEEAIARWQSAPSNTASATATRKEHTMRRFTMYRRGDISATHDTNQANPADEPQFEGVVFADGSVAIRWRTAVHSTAVWASLDDVLTIHGHPEYGSELVWHDE